MSTVETNEKKYITDETKVEIISMKRIFHDVKFNCRGQIAPIDVVELARNIKEIGLVQPIILQPYGGGPPGTDLRIVAGYRRHMAHVVNCTETIRGIIVEGLTDVDAKIINLSENLNRKDLNLLQESKAVLELARQGMTQMAMADRLHVSRGWIQIRLYTLKLPAAIQEDIKAGWVTSEHIVTLHGLSEQEQYDTVKMIKDKKATDGMRTRVPISKSKMKKDASKPVRRDHVQISKMREHIQDSIKSNFGTRCLAWAAGDISTNDLYTDIEDIADEKGITYFRPSDDVSC